MLLVLTNSKDQTADYLCEKLKEKDLEFLRVDTDRIANTPPYLSVSYKDYIPEMTIDGKKVCPQDISFVWYRRPEPIKIVDKSLDEAEAKLVSGEWAAAMDGFFSHIPIRQWINHPSCCMAASYKPEQITRAKINGLSVPQTLVTLNLEDSLSFFRRNNNSVIVKPLCSGYLEREDPSSDSVIYTSIVNDFDLLDSTILSKCPTFFQEMILKEFDVRIVVLDHHLRAVKMSVEEPQSVDIRYDNMCDVKYSSIDVPIEIRNSLISLISSYGLRFAAVDMAVTSDGKWVFFEINPNGQWAWLDIVGGMNIYEMFVETFEK